MTLQLHSAITTLSPTMIFLHFLATASQSSMISCKSVAEMWRKLQCVVCEAQKGAYKIMNFQGFLKLLTNLKSTDNNRANVPEASCSADVLPTCFYYTVFCILQGTCPMCQTHVKRLCSQVRNLPSVCCMTPEQAYTVCGRFARHYQRYVH